MVNGDFLGPFPDSNFFVATWRLALGRTILGADGSFNPGAPRLISGRTIMVGFGPPASRSARREWWRRQIQRQKEGSLSVAEFCRRLGVSTVTFYAWKRRFREAPPALPLVPERPSARPMPERLIGHLDQRNERLQTGSGTRPVNGHGDPTRPRVPDPLTRPTGAGSVPAGE